MRDLQADDFDKGYMALLAQLTETGDVTKEAFSSRFAEISSNPDYKILVLEDTETGKVIGTATLVVERKFFRGLGKSAHIEDLVIDSNKRGQKLGARLVNALAEAAQSMGCYKVVLDCTEAQSEFYTKCGFVQSKRKEKQMAKYFTK